ncbi:hypothetical protein PCE1_000201 [Barthelona sp. PCE]
MVLVWLAILLFSSFISILLIRYYLDQRGEPKSIWGTRTSLYLLFMCSCVCLFIFPMDLKNAIHHEAVVSKGSIKGALFFVFWFQMIYTFVVVPMQQEMSRAGDFTVKGRFFTSLKINSIFYTVVILLAGFALGIVSVKNGWSASYLVTFCVALSQGYGLLIEILTLGYGSIYLPRTLFRLSNVHKQKDYLEYESLQKHENLEIAQNAMKLLCEESVDMFNKCSQFEEFRPKLEKIKNLMLDQYSLPLRYKSLVKCSSVRRRQLCPITEKDLVKLHTKLIAADSVLRKATVIWNILLKRYSKYNAIVNAEDEETTGLLTESVIIEMPDWKLMVYKRIIPLFYKVIAVIWCVLVGFFIFCNCMFIFNVKPLRGLNQAFRYSATFNTLFLTVIFITCSSAFFKLKILKLYHIVPHSTDPFSFLYTAAYVLRLVLPLSWNYALLCSDWRGDDEKTVFMTVIGTIDLAPLLGTGFMILLPVGILIVSFFTLTSKSKFWSDDDEAINKDEMLMGRSLIQSCLIEHDIGDKYNDMFTQSVNEGVLVSPIRPISVRTPRK